MTEMTATPVVLTAEMASDLHASLLKALFAEAWPDEMAALSAIASGSVVCRVADGLTDIQIMAAYNFWYDGNVPDYSEQGVSHAVDDHAHAAWIAAVQWMRDAAK